MASLNGHAVGRTGFGLMRMTWAPVQTPDDQCFALMKKSLELGSNFWNSGEFYGQPEATLNLQLLNRYFTVNPTDASKVILSVKGGMDFTKRSADGSPAGIKKSLDNILSIIDGKKFLDFFEPARVDPNVPIETTIEAIAEYVKAGKLGGIMLSECSADTIRRASKVHKISGVEVEYSLWSTDIRDNGILDACKECEVPIIAYSPLGFGFLTGQIKTIDDLPKDDHRRHFARLQPENFDKNFELVDKVNAIAAKHKVTPSQLALEWLRAQSKDGLVVVPIPGTTSLERLEENVKEVGLGDDELRELEDILTSFQPQGVRYMSAVQHTLYGDSKRL